MPEPLGSQKWLALVLIGTENTVSEVCSWQALAQQEAGLFSPLSCPLFLFKLSEDGRRPDSQTRAEGKRS